MDLGFIKPKEFTKCELIDFNETGYSPPSPGIERKFQAYKNIKKHFPPQHHISFSFPINKILKEFSLQKGLFLTVKVSDIVHIMPNKKKRAQVYMLRMTLSQ